MKIEIIIKDPPEAASERQIREYVEDALIGWGGGFHVDDELFEGLLVTKFKIVDEEGTE